MKPKSVIFQGQRLALALAVAACPGAWAAEAASEKPSHDVLVFGNLGDYAHPAERPTRERPLYYVAMAGGLHTEGDSVAGDGIDKITADDVWKPLQKALASQYYLPAGKDTPKPTQLIVFHWGAMTPDLIDTGADALVFSNHKNMGDLVGHTRVDRFLQGEFEEMYNRATERRFFIVATAFDYAAATGKPRLKKQLWRTRMSVPTAGTTMPLAIVPMVTSGAPLFGRDTPQAQEFKWGRGQVEIGDLKVVEPPAPAKK